MIKKNFYAISGGPGAGKTTLLQYLAQKGIPHIPETARAIIKNRLQTGLPPRPSPVEFARQIFETDRSVFVDSLPVDTPLLFDRTFIDSALMLQKADPQRYIAATSFMNTHRFNPIVFMAPPWKEIYAMDDERDQTFKEAVAVYERLYDWYGLQGYMVCDLPKCDVKERADFMLDVIAR